MNVKNLYSVYVYLIINFSNCHGQLQPEPTDLNNLSNQLNQLLSPQHIFQNLFDPEGIVPDPVQKCFQELKTDEDKCWFSLCELFLAFVDPKDQDKIPNWAVKMWDSAGRARSPGKFDAQWTDFGRYEACVDIQVAERNITVINNNNPEISQEILIPAFTGKYTRLFSSFTPNKGSHSGTQMKKLQQLSAVSISTTVKPQRKWNISVVTDGPDKLSDHKDFGIDFEALGITNVLTQDFILGLIVQPPQLGMCAPSTCSDDLLMQTFNKALSYLDFKDLGNLTISHVYSADKDAHTGLTLLDKFCIAMISVFLALVILGTSWDVLVASKRKQKDSSPSSGSPSIIIKLLLCFSVYSNGKKILSTTKLKGSIDCIHGIRFFSMCWVVMGHTWYVNLKAPPDNIFDLGDAYSEPIMLSVWSGLLSVDTFFFLSGFLVAYSLTKELEKLKKRVNILKISLAMYLHRYIRLTPAYACLMLVFSSLVLHFGDGPNWILVEKQVQGCTENWWKNLLYINNMFKNDEYLCMGVTWYLACDFQMFVFAPFVVWLMWRFNEYFVGLCALAISSIIPATLTWYYNWGPLETTFVTLKESELGEHSWMFEFYYRFYNRAGPYVVGLLLGFYMQKNLNINRTKGKKLPLYIVICGWVVSTATALALVYGVHNYYEVDLSCVFEANKQCFPTAGAVIYAAFARSAWGVVVGWVIFACHTGYGGPIATFLSWPGFFPLSRLTYCLYLIHLSVMFIFYGIQKSTIHYDGYTMMYFFFGNLCMCSFAATLATLFFESPFIGLEKIIFGRTSSLEKGNKPSGNENEKSKPDKSLNLSESTALEHKTDIDDVDKQDKTTNGSISNGVKSENHQNSYRHKSFDNVAYEP